MFDSSHTAPTAFAPSLPADRRARPRLPAPPPRPVLAAACAALADLVAVALVMIGAAGAVPAVQSPLMAALLLTMVCVFAARGHFTTRLPFGREAADIAAATIVSLAVFSVLASRMGAPPGAGAMVRWLAFMPLCLALRVVAAICARRSGAGPVRTLIVGEPEAADEVAAALTSERRLLHHVTQSITAEALKNLVARMGAAPQAMNACHADLAVVALGADPHAEAEILSLLGQAGIRYAVVPAVRALPVRSLTAQTFFGHDVVILRPATPAAPEVTLKSVLDIATALALLIPLAPLMAMIALLIRRDGGPALFSHRRIGRGGKPFGCLKFRTMVIDAEQRLAALLATDPEAAAEWRETRKLRRDPRVTALGRILRKTSLDELPQLINVLRGEMSLVGPRPVVEAELTRYDADRAYYCRARPGVTGLWQVSGRSDTSYERRVRLDVWYVRNWSLWHDISILLKTVPAVIQQRGSV